MSHLSITLAENISTAFTVVLNTEPANDVTINILSDDASEAEVDQLFLSFTNSAGGTPWNIPQTVTVSGIQDGVIDGNQITSINPENCAVSPTGNSLWIRVDGQYTEGLGASYTLDAVEIIPELPEGTAATPVVLSYVVYLPYAGTVDGTQSYYELIGLTADAYYQVSLSGLSADADLFVYDEASFTSLLCNSQLSSISSENCDASPTGDSLWIRVDGQYIPGAAFILNAIKFEILEPDFTSSNTPLALLDFNSLTDTLNVTGAPVSLTSVEVLVDITHTFDKDIIITLISPAGTQVMLSNKNGGSGDNYTNTTFSDSATQYISTGAAPFTGWFIPEESLSALNGENGNGTWSLKIEDTAAADSGDLLTWGVKLQ